MLKQVSNRNQRTKGFKVKQGFKIFTLIVAGIWLLHQLKQHSHEKMPYEETSAKTFETLKVGSETKRLGRKGLQPRSNDKLFELEDTEENELERDDSIVGHDGERTEEEESEEVEDLIDEQDKEKEEQNEDEDSEEMGKQMEDMSLLEDEGHDEGENDTQSKSEKYNKETGASRVFMRMTKSLGSEFEFGELRKVKEEQVGSSKGLDTEKQKKKIMDSSKVIGHSTDSFPNVLATKGINDVLDFGAGSKIRYLRNDFDSATYSMPRFNMGALRNFFSFEMGQLHERKNKSHLEFE
ncbi:uncharacterized protein HKW66_Vig0100640 [Vigna angularis]|uniref:Uncharacterized protein n=3 Tax=Phaseolus angularis TaxID=3914 RepID=A0A8T0KLX5_PHAAN|nr:uncharacterized protein LOC108330979 [Vigna angularis]XP_017421072.1 uncharacterized protein LOC108330979 [Vigna angularis]KAG2400082.1 uncharacterized protein HKW66_Vig0100640 [Vigna angularis]BAT78383.1 hypothetical protein VIGAN_02105300 [Vigna angularis var. angularis]